MTKLKIACIFGTRPEAIKMAPVIHEFEQRPEIFDTHIICTGQHQELLYPLITWFNLNIKIDMKVMEPNQSLSGLTSRLMAEFGPIFDKEKYDFVLGQGDTATVLTSALAAFYEKIPFAHVEAGLRTFDRNSPFPEEMNRSLVGQLATLHFAPTLQAAENLKREGVSANSITITGNTVIDAVHYTVNRLKQRGTVSSPNSRLKKIFVTVHRRENFGEPLYRICKAIKRIVSQQKDVHVLFSVHPNPNVKAVVYKLLADVENIRLVDPMPYPDLMAELQECYLIMTDSGGLQEEAPSLNRPVLILREETERIEIVELGGARLVGSDEDLIVNSVNELINDQSAYEKMIIGYSPFGDGHASKLIVDQVEQFLMEVI